MNGCPQDRGAEFTAAELDDAARAAWALVRARHDGRTGDMTAILGTMSQHELLAVVPALAAVAREFIVRTCALRVLVADEDAAAAAMDTPVDEMNPAGLRKVAELLASVHAKSGT